MTFVITLPHVVNGRTVNRNYDVGDIVSVGAYQGNNDRYDVTLTLHGGRTQWLEARTAIRLWREWKKHNRCSARACFFRRDADTPGDCTFCQMADEMERIGYRVLPELPRFRVQPMHVIVAGIVLAIGFVGVERVGHHSPPSSAQTVAKRPNNKAVGTNRHGGGGVPR